MNARLHFDLEGNTISEIYDNIEKWICSSEMSYLIKIFNGKMPDNISLEDTVSWLLSFSDVWDYRSNQARAYDKGTGEKARWLVTDHTITNEQKECVFNIIPALGLKGHVIPSKKRYDYVIVVGGAKMSCFFRPQYASKLIYDNKISTKAIVLLGTERPISESERVATDSYDKEAKTEFDLINTGAKLSFNLDTLSKIENYNEENSNLGHRVYTYMDVNKKIPVIAFSAPSKDPLQRRANTADTYDFFISQYDIKPKSSFLVITSQIYAPYQQMEALRTLSIPYEISVETVGYITNVENGEIINHNAANYLQEIRSTIQSISRFISKYPLNK